MPGPTLPLQLRLEGRRVLVVGAGHVGVRRAATLAAAGAVVVVVAPRVDPEAQALADRPPSGSGGTVELRIRAFEPGDLDDAALVVVAVDDRSVADDVHGEASRRGVLVNRADDASLSDVSFPATLRRGPLSVAVSTSSEAPAVARWAAERLDERLDEVLGLDPAAVAVLVELVAEVRAELAGGPGAAGSGVVDWRSALDASILDLINRGRRAEAKERLLACRSSS